MGPGPLGTEEQLQRPAAATALLPRARGVPGRAAHSAVASRAVLALCWGARGLFTLHPRPLLRLKVQGLDFLETPQ